MHESDRFLLIKGCYLGFWSEVWYVAGHLLLAELTNRIPVVYWGADTFYSSDQPEIKDGFTMYFRPVSNYTVNHLENENYTFYPSRWNSGNLRLPMERKSLELYDLPSLFSRKENVLVSNSNQYIYIGYLMQWIPENHPAYGLNYIDIYRYMYQKYFKLQPDVFGEIENFYLKNIANKHPVLGVHIRGTDKIYELPNLNDVNASYPNEINNHLIKNPYLSIFLLTDCEKTLNNFKALYGNKLIFTDSFRSPHSHIATHYGFPSYNNKQKGIDIIKDTYLAMKCDYFIGNRTSNVTTAVSWLKVWQEGAIKLLG